MPLVTDLRTGSMLGGCAELALMNAASAQMSHFYGIPVYNSCGITESKIPDIQAGFEKGLTTAVTALAGAQYNHHAAGMLESLLAVAYEQYVIDDDINGQVMRLVRGLDVTEESLSLDVIHEVCNGEGHYLGQPQTIELMNTEYHYPHTADRATRADWEAAGSLDMRERARRRAQELLRTNFPGRDRARGGRGDPVDLQHSAAAARHGGWRLSMIGGTHGQILHVDLTTGATRIERPADEFYRLLVGGRAVVAYFLLRDLAPGTPALSPDNLLIFAPGILQGSNFPGAAGTGWAANRRLPVPWAASRPAAGGGTSSNAPASTP